MTINVLSFMLTIADLEKLTNFEDVGNFVSTWCWVSMLRFTPNHTLLKRKKRMCNSLIFLEKMPISDWCVVYCGSKNKSQKTHV